MYYSTRHDIVLSIELQCCHNANITDAYTKLQKQTARHYATIGNIVIGNFCCDPIAGSIRERLNLLTNQILN
jgi:hypothetical protein